MVPAGGSFRRESRTAGSTSEWGQCATRRGLPFNAHDEGHPSPANPRRSGGHGVKHGLDIGRRGADDPEDLAVAVCCSSASFVSLNKRTFSIAITAWSARFEQVDVLVGERSNTLLVDHDHADRAPAKNGDREQTPVTVLRGERAAVLRIQRDVGNRGRWRR
jgi:hypothetical protein